MVRSMLATATSLVLTTTVITHAYYLKRQFYPTVVYLTKSSPSMAMERSPNISVLFHFRVTSLMGLLTVLDLLFVNHACHSIMTRGASVQLVFGFEYAILLTIVLSIFIKYILHSIDLQSENPWDNKAVYMLYTELLTGFIKVLLYMAFMTITIKLHTFPLFAIRPMYLTMRQFKKAVTDAIMSRRAIRNMNTLYPDASAEELQLTDNVCIICREEMVSGAKRLPCNHIFHTSCLRSWFQRQQTCPTCRMDVLRTTLPAQANPPPEQPRPQIPLVPQQPNLPPGVMPPFPPGLFPFWPPMGHLGQNFFPQAPAAGPNTLPPNASAPSGSDAQTNVANGDALQNDSSGLEPSPASSIPGFPFSFPPFSSAPWVGLPPPPPLAMPPMPMPPTGFAGLTEEELRAMEGQERQNLEARLQCLQNIHTLLDAAMVQIHQYLSVVATLSPPRTMTSEGTAPSAETMEPTTGMQVDSLGESARPPIPAASTTSTEPTITPEEIGQSELEGAVGYTMLDSDNPPEDGDDPLGEPDTAELRRRRLQKLERPGAQH
ncbi:E3 ubiquitin-protein ligase synoviolin isoform X2 [Narcine bancroftii]|uniref:E3 ubiquitin-protein ligase synoviolin isoform X2 n=1 Tax=Narcine bancroftii TaxID=1343680 RepID=UPI0038312A69